jgi:hypothetical protein
MRGYEDGKIVNGKRPLNGQMGGSGGLEEIHRSTPRRKASNCESEDNFKSNSRSGEVDNKREKRRRNKFLFLFVVSCYSMLYGCFKLCCGVLWLSHSVFFFFFPTGRPHGRVYLRVVIIV